MKTTKVIKCKVTKVQSNAIKFSCFGLLNVTFWERQFTELEGFFFVEKVFFQRQELLRNSKFKSFKDETVTLLLFKILLGVEILRSQLQLSILSSQFPSHACTWTV